MSAPNDNAPSAEEEFTDFVAFTGKNARNLRTLFAATLEKMPERLLAMIISEGCSTSIDCLVSEEPAPESREKIVKALGMEGELSKTMFRRDFSGADRADEEKDGGAK